MRPAKRSPLLATTSRTNKQTQVRHWELRKIINLCLVGIGLCGFVYVGIVQTALRIKPTTLHLAQAMTLRGSFEDIDGKMCDLARFAGNVSLVVNVASHCGLTDSNYKGLQLLYEKYRDQGFVVLAFPCNQFGKQEPEDCPTIKAFAKSTYHVTFPMFSKVDVNGPDTHPVYVYLKSHLPDVEQRGGPGFDLPWNFPKFLVGRDGRPVLLLPEQFRQEEIETAILTLLRPEAHLMKSVMDFKGQKLSESLSSLLLWLGGLLAFVVGYYLKDFEAMLQMFGCCVLFTALLVVPDWPFYNRNPVQWSTAARVEADGTSPPTVEETRGRSR